MNELVPAILEWVYWVSIIGAGICLGNFLTKKLG